MRIKNQQLQSYNRTGLLDAWCNLLFVKKLAVMLTAMDTPSLYDISISACVQKC